MTEVAFPCDRVPDDAGAARLLGLYPQRQPGRWMQRVKVPGGSLTVGQWQELGQIARQFTPTAPLHLTTRQDIELHDIPMDAVAPVQRALAGAGLTGLGACGDTLRNITVCPCAGTRAETPELLPLAWQIRQTLEAAAGILALPRKFKIALCCSAACGQPWVNDLGFIARRREGRWGFAVTAGGSLGAQPGTAMRLSEWLPSSDVLPLTMAGIRVFAAHGDRQHRSRARLRHVRQHIGDEAFSALLREGLQAAKAEHRWPEADLPIAAVGFAAHVTLSFANGDIAPAGAAALGDLAACANARVRIANYHRVIVFGREELWLRQAVGKFDSLTPAAMPQAAVVSCPGRRWCKRALTDTNALADRIRKELHEKLGPEMTVCVSGCPNGCAHSAVADIGLTGVLVAKDSGRQEAYDVRFGGGLGRNDRLAETVARGLLPEDALAAVRRLAGQLAESRQR